MRKSRLPYKGKVKPGDPRKLGVTYSKEGIHFAVSIKDGKEAFLLLYKKDCDSVWEIPLPFEDRVGDISAIIIEDIDFYGYNYLIDGKIFVDPYGKEIIGRKEFGSPEKEQMGRIVKENYIWKSKKDFYIPYEDTILYKIHVRGFTKQNSSKVKNKGTFLGIIEKIPYFKRLGITTLELMPAYEFEELQIQGNQEYPLRYEEKGIKRLNYWGYTKGNYFAPKYSYSGEKGPIQEFKEMVDKLHKNQLECIMEFYFPEEVSPSFVLEVMRFWVLEYKVDGFHLLGDGVCFGIIGKDPLLTKTKLLFSNINGNEVYHGSTPYCRNLGEYNTIFQDTARKFLKGDEDQLRSFAYHIRKNPATNGVVNYITNNDGFTLCDLVSYDKKHNEANGEENQDGPQYNYSWNCGVEGTSRKLSIRRLRTQQQKNAILFLMLAQGTPLLYGGDEFNNSNRGNNNSYCQDNEIGWVDWEGFSRSKELYDFVKQAIIFRKSHRILHKKEELRIMDYRSLGYPDLSYHSSRAWYGNFDTTSRTLGVMYNGLYGDQEKIENSIYVAYNMHWEPYSFALPHLPEPLSWYKIIDTSKKQSFLLEEVLLEEQRMVGVAPRTICVLISKGKKQESET